MADASYSVTPNSGWTPERLDHLRSLADQKLTARQIATAMGVSRNTVMGKLRRAGIVLQSGLKNGGPRVANATSKAGAKTPRVQLNAITGTPNYSGPAIVVEKFKPRQAKGVKPLLVSFGDLAAGHCRWPYGDRPPFQFCGCLTGGDKPYCDGHSKISRAG